MYLGFSSGASSLSSYVAKSKHQASDKWYQSFGCKVIETITKTPKETTSKEVKKVVKTLSTVNKGKKVVLKGKPMVSRLKAIESHLDGIVTTIEVPWWPCGGPMQRNCGTQGRAFKG
ncbi:hypothetical protein PVK06_032996 [Gossypium arboreum]|uniref:Uncharacterized protein n=1 Tax=Gossypium arboreum TaxID=29729 RepID=A0ABR0ND07_GOSAR|nr:hypothetical protein PVK06_032996 [Gossypium arboreum]